MGLSSFPSVGEETLPAVLIFHAIFSVALIKKLVVYYWASLGEGEQERKKKRVSTTQFKYLPHGSRSRSTSRSNSDFVGLDDEKCCVCLCGYKGGEEVSELISCKHFFHKVCLDSWFGYDRVTCPICRSMI